MRMMVKKRQCKLVALFLLIVFLVPFIPVAPVSADPLPVQVPDFPYNQDSYYNVNNGGFALWQVHGSNHVSYVQTFSSGAVGNPDPIVIYNRSFWADNSTYYLDVNYITDTWDIYGNHIDGWPGSNTSNIRLPYPFHDTVDSEVYATLIYCSDDVRWRNGSDTGIYMYMNYMVPGYADPTPTPMPSIPMPDDMPAVENLSLMCKAVCNYGSNFFDSYINPRDYVFVYTDYYNDNSSPKAYLWNTIEGDAFGHIFGVGAEGNYSGNMYFYKFNNDTQELTFLGSLGSSYGYNDGGRVFNAGLSFVEYGWTGRTVLNTCNFDFVRLGTTRNFAQKPYFFVYWTNSDITSGEDPNGATPTPTSAPTPIPQPSTTPAPTEPPDDGDDGNWTGLFGWLKKLVNAIISIPVKIVNGLLSALKYIFIPDIGKIKALFNTLNDKFGINVPGTFEFDPILLKNPENVVMHFKPISLNGESTETVDITIIDFDKVDDWLESAPGQIIIRLIQAVYMLTMWGYMIYIFRKHIATVNYTDADTLEHSKYWES